LHICSDSQETAKPNFEVVKTFRSQDTASGPTSKLFGTYIAISFLFEYSSY